MSYYRIILVAVARIPPHTGTSRNPADPLSYLVLHISPGY